MSKKKPGAAATAYPGTIRTSNITQYPSPEQCTRFQKCSAPICPLDNNWRTRVHYKGERICNYLRERAKGTLRLKIHRGYPWKHSFTLLRVYAEIISPDNPPLKSLRSDLLKIVKNQRNSVALMKSARL